MTSHAAGSFDVDSWDSRPAEDGDTTEFGHARLTKTFHGDFGGRSTTHLLTVGTPVEGSAGYVALERFQGTVNGRAGGFVLQHSAWGDRGAQSGTWMVVPDSGTGELAGMRGSATITQEPDGGHGFKLDYELDAEPG